LPPVKTLSVFYTICYGSARHPRIAAAAQNLFDDSEEGTHIILLKYTIK